MEKEFKAKELSLRSREAVQGAQAIPMAPSLVSSVVRYKSLKYILFVLSCMLNILSVFQLFSLIYGWVIQITSGVKSHKQ